MWWDHKNAHTKELYPGSAVTVFFSVRCYDYNGRYGRFDGVNTAIAFNVLAVILISEDWDVVKSGEYLPLGDRALGVDGSRGMEEFNTVDDEII
jgi:hypothetical protein